MMTLHLWQKDRMVLFSYGGNDPIPGFTCVSRDKNKQTKQVRVISYLTKEKKLSRLSLRKDPSARHRGSVLHLQSNKRKPFN